MNKKFALFSLLFLLFFSCSLACSVDILFWPEQARPKEDFLVFGRIICAKGDVTNATDLRINLTRHGLEILAQPADYLGFDGNDLSLTEGFFIFSFEAPENETRFNLTLFLGEDVVESKNLDINPLLERYPGLSLGFNSVNIPDVSFQVFMNNTLDSDINGTLSFVSSKTSTTNFSVYNNSYKEFEILIDKEDLGVEEPGRHPVVIFTNHSLARYSVLNNGFSKSTSGYYSLWIGLPSPYTIRDGGEESFYFKIRNNGIRSDFQVRFSGELVRQGYLQYLEEISDLGKGEERNVSFWIGLPRYSAVQNKTVVMEFFVNNITVARKVFSVEILPALAIHITGLVLDKSKYFGGEDVGVEVFVKNEGDLDADVTLLISYDGKQVEAAVPLSIAPGQVESKSFALGPAASKTLVLHVEARASFGSVYERKNVTIKPRLYNFDFEVFADEFTLEEGESGEISISIENTGNSNDNYTFSLLSWEEFFLPVVHFSLEMGNTSFLNFTIKNEKVVSGDYLLVLSVCSETAGSCKERNVSVFVPPSGELKTPVFSQVDDTHFELFFESDKNTGAFVNLSFDRDDVVVLPSSSFLLPAFSNVTVSAEVLNYNPRNLKVSASYGGEEFFSEGVVLKTFEGEEEPVEPKISLGPEQRRLVIVAFVIIIAVFVFVFLKYIAKKSIYDFWR